MTDSPVEPPLDSPDTAPPGPVSGLLFDLDGTLIATRRLYLEAFADALEPVMGRRPSHEEMMAHRPRSEVRFLRDITGIVLRERLEAGVPDDFGSDLETTREEVLTRFFDSYRRRHPTDFEGIYSGVPEMLEIGRSHGLPMGVVTGKSRRSWSITSALVELGDFHRLVFDDDVSECKPDPGGLTLALDALGTSPPETLYIGDSLTDLDAAVAAGVVPVAALWSKRDHEREAFAEAARDRGGLALPTPADLETVLGLSGTT